MRKHLILTMSAVALAACGGDSGSDEDTTFTGSATTTATATVTMTDPTLDDDGSSTDTIDPDTGSTSETGTATADDTTGGPNDLVPFRVNGFALRDPHLIFEGDDVTIDSVNAPLNTAINSDVTNDMLLDFGLVLLFRPLDQVDGGIGEFYLSNGACTFPADTSTCDPAQGTTASFSMYQVTTVGPCLPPNVKELSDYPVPPEPPTGTPGPCFVSGPTMFTLRTPLFAMPMTEVTVAAQLMGDPAENLAQGNIHGFLSSADADATMVNLPQVGMMPLSDLLDPDDMEGDGWRMYFAFTAIPTVWTGPTD